MDRGISMLGIWFAAVMLAVAFVTDITKQKIPNWLTVTGAISGLIFHLATTGWNGLAFSAAGLACGFAPMLALYVLRAVGAGDVKLFAALGAFTGAVFSLYAMAASLICAGLIALFVLLWRSDGVQRLTHAGFLLIQLAAFRKLSVLKSDPASDGRLRFPFMWAVLPGVIITIIQWEALGI